MAIVSLPNNKAKTVIHISLIDKSQKTLLTEDKGHIQLLVTPLTFILPTENGELPCNI